MKLSTGYEFYANDDIIGINPEGEIFTGYDDTFYHANSGMALEDREALADYMIGIWTAYKKSLEDTSSKRS